jgi:hypothetical protein
MVCPSSTWWWLIWTDESCRSVYKILIYFIRMAVFGRTISTLYQDWLYCSCIILLYSIFYAYRLTCCLTDDNLWKSETYCGCNVQIIKLHIDIVLLFGYNEVDCVCVCVFAFRHSNFCNSSHNVFITELRELSRNHWMSLLAAPDEEGVLPAPSRSQPNWRLSTEDNFFVSEAKESCPL